MKFIDAMVRGYLECCARSTGGTDSKGVEHEHMEQFDFSDEALKEARETCRDFLVDNFDAIARLVYEFDVLAGRIGHDLWLTREHHGAGFWDRGYGHVGDELTEAAHALGSGNAYLGDDDLIYFM